VNFESSATHHWIRPRRAPSGKITTDDRDKQQHERRNRKHTDIEALHVKKELFNESR
jgi:hypothetical protein